MIAVTVSQLNRYMKSVMDEDKKLRDLYVRGEISNFSRHFKSGHCYFSLKDESSVLRAVMFCRYAGDLAFTPQNGMSVLARGNVGVYERDGSYQLYVTDMQPDGVGALAIAYEQRKTKLAAAGLFDEAYKKPLPAFPKRIGVVTSETGAALQDIQHVLARRYPLATLVLCPAIVQGEAAGASVADAVRALDSRCDVMIVGRGGGSMEDLWGFNDEKLAYAIFECLTPVVSAVGHETDFTLCDFVADMRAPTPSAAAELVSPSVEQLRRQMDGYRAFLRGAADEIVATSVLRFNAFRRHPALRSPMGSVEKQKEKLDFLCDSLYNKKRIFIRQLSASFQSRAALLDSLSPLRVLERGYTLALKDSEVVYSIKALQKKDGMTLRFWDGEADVRVQSIRESQIHEKKHYI